MAFLKLHPDLSGANELNPTAHNISCSWFIFKSHFLHHENDFGHTNSDNSSGNPNSGSISEMYV